MLLLVIADNYVLLYVWEIVGLASYLLIGSGTISASATTRQKAFVMNRVGDAA